MTKGSETREGGELARRKRRWETGGWGKTTQEGRGNFAHERTFVSGKRPHLLQGPRGSPLYPRVLKRVGGTGTDRRYL